MKKQRKWVVVGIILILSYIGYNIYIEYKKSILYEEIINIYIEQMNKAIEHYEKNK